MSDHARSPRHVLLGLLALAAIPGFLFLDTGLAIARAWEPPTTDAERVLPASGIALALIALAACVGAGRAFMARRWPQMLLLLGSTASFWLVAELLLGLVQPDLQWFHRSVPNQVRLWTPNPEWMPGISGESRHTANSLGIRGPEFPPRDEAYRILCVGGSTTANLYLDDEETWTHLLMVMLDEDSAPGRFWVGSVGQSGYASWQHVSFFQSSRLLDQVDMVLTLVGANDLSRALKGAPVATNMEAAPLWTRSNIYQGARIVTKVLFHQNVQEAETQDGSKYLERRASRRRAEIVKELPDLSQALADYQANLRAMIEVARSRGVLPVFASQPMLWSEHLSPRAHELLWLGMLEDGRYLDAGTLGVAMDRFNQALFEVCRETGVECIDLSSLSGNESYFFDDAHFTEAGSIEVARKISFHLESHPALLATRADSSPGPP